MALQRTNSQVAFEQSRMFMPGGVNSPVRAAAAVGCNPLFLRRGLGSRVWDIDGNCFIDYVGSWGPLILGHAHPEVIGAVHAAAGNGLSFGAPTELETELASVILEAFPSMDKIRLVNSGTEATMSAIRLARGVTGRDLIVKFAGCYHGHSDALLVKAGSGALTTGVPTSAGVSEQVAATTLVADFNDTEGIRALFREYGEQIAAVIIEPIAGNMGVVLPQEGFLQELRKLSFEYGSLLIFDEVMTGFRVVYGGAQTICGIDPDITCLGKIIGGGLPLAAYGGKAHIMEHISPEGPVYQAGTLSGNPLAVTAGLATLGLLRQPGLYEVLEETTTQLAAGIRDCAERHHQPVQVNHRGGMISVFFTQQEVTDYNGACSSNTDLFAQFYREMLEAGIYLPPSQFESWFVSTAHSRDDIELTLKAVEKALSECYRGKKLQKCEACER